MVEIGQKKSFINRDKWRAWLEKNHAIAKELWLVLYKIHTGKVTISYAEAVEEALCFGWIDGVVKSIDAEKYAVRFTERKRASIWSQANKRRVAQMTHQGRMTQAGLVKVNEAKQNGEWHAATIRENPADIPSNLRIALAKNKSVQKYFYAIAPSHKRQYIYWITGAKTDATRNKRIAETIKMLKSKMNNKVR